MTNIEIWASGGGTNANAIIEYFNTIDDIQIVNVGCNRREAGAFNVARKHNIPSTYWGKSNWSSDLILAELKKRKVHFIVLAGFLKLVPEEVTKRFLGHIVNIHPSLLPSYGGKDMYGERVHNAVLSNQENKTGITIHEVNEEFDKGKILGQYSVSLNPTNETLDSIKLKIQQLEHTNFSPTIESWIRSKV
ncbi:MAG: phosphoribosylglycinamide formyltransferase [Bacteroidetes bacterium]|nr:MAG: phosphoribosylglycinamide formyltransferase [Bacteroidota bacterium]